MKKTPQLPEIVFSSSDPAESKRISRHVKAGRLHKIAARIYTSSDEAPDIRGASHGGWQWPFNSPVYECRTCRKWPVAGTYPHRQVSMCLLTLQLLELQ